MLAQDIVFAGSIPELYEDYLVPLFFRPYATDLARRVERELAIGSTLEPRRVLEIAAGTGVVTRAMDRVLSREVDLVATDLNQPMLDRAASIRTGRRILFQQANALELPFDDASFDVVVCQFGVMFFPDKAGAFAEARRVLRDGGTLLFNVWDRLEENELADAVTAELARVFPDDAPRFLARTPHGYYERAIIEADLANGGFASAPAFDVIAACSRAESARVAAVGICQGTPVRNEIEARRSPSLADATAACTNAIARRFGDGPIEGRMKAIVVTVRR